VGDMFVLRRAQYSSALEMGLILEKADLIAIDEALAHVESLIVTQGAGDPTEALAARVDVLRLQIYMVQDILQSLIEAMSAEAALKESS
jgi:hypothetical protein